MRFSAARYSFRKKFLVDRSGNVGQQLRSSHSGPFLIALTESWKEECKCYRSFSESDLKRVEKTASCAISIHSSFLTIGDRRFAQVQKCEFLQCFFASPVLGPSSAR